MAEEERRVTREQALEREKLEDYAYRLIAAYNRWYAVPNGLPKPVDTHEPITIHDPCDAIVNAGWSKRHGDRIAMGARYVGLDACARHGYGIGPADVFLEDGGRLLSA